MSSIPKEKNNPSFWRSLQRVPMLGIWLGWFMSQQGLLAATVDTSPPLREPAGKPSIRAIQVETGPTIDGQLDESVWLQAPAAGPLWQYDPATSEAMSEKTLFRILYDKDYSTLAYGAMIRIQGPSMHGSCARQPIHLQRRLSLHGLGYLPRPAQWIYFCRQPERCTLRPNCQQ